MKIKRDETIQKLVDQIPSHVLLEVASLVIPAQGELCEAETSGSEAHFQGVEAGLELATEWHRKSSVRYGAATIFLAEQEVGGGLKDRIYFVGRKVQIVAKLERLREDHGNYGGR